MRVDRLGALLDLLASKTEAAFDARDFDSRLRIQKTIYLLQAFKYAPVSRYNFSRYFHGPYSPDLARDYYALAEGKVKASTDPIALPANAVTGIINAIRRGNEFLEAASTLHMVATRNRAGEGEAIETVRQMKPHLNHDTMTEAWRFLVETRLVDAAT